jgi:hypothetical protein|tara:strand:- start:1326 stop:1655 length:330 start_codon:yes stop_codon:yes gene_type:complete
MSFLVRDNRGTKPDLMPHEAFSAVEQYQGRDIVVEHCYTEEEALRTIGRWRNRDPDQLQCENDAKLREHHATLYRYDRNDVVKRRQKKLGNNWVLTTNIIRARHRGIPK